MLRMVMVNLISYALNFTPACSNVEIDIGFQSQKAEAIAFIRNNGVGFDMTFADELFGVFQRLHRADQFEVQGLGWPMLIGASDGSTVKVGWKGMSIKAQFFYYSLP